MGEFHIFLVTLRKPLGFRCSDNVRSLTALNPMNSKLVSLSLVSALGLAASAASAQVIMLDFGPTTASGANLTNSPYHSANGSFSGSTWNTLGTADSSSIVFSNNSASGVSVDLGQATTTTTINLATQPVSSSALGNPTGGGIYAGNSVGTDGIFTTTNGTTGVTRVGMQVGGLLAGTYDIYITARNTNTAAAAATYTQTAYIGTSSTSGNFDFSGFTNLGTLTYANPNASTSFTSTWVQGENYLKLSVTLAANDFLNLAIAGGGSENRGFLNSVQIVNTTIVPEPSSFAALAGLGALGLVGLRRRSRR
jgi:hypothetical protein